MSGIGEEMGDVGLAIQRAEDKTAQMQARAGAIDELIASGALDDVTAIGPGDDITRELEAMSSQSEVEAELARLKGAQQPEAISAPASGRAGAPGTTARPRPCRPAPRRPPTSPLPRPRRTAAGRDRPDHG